MSEIEVNTYSFRDLRYLRVYCRYCGRQHTFWDQVKHTKQCLFAQAFRDEFEQRRAYLVALSVEKHETSPRTPPAAPRHPA